MTLADYIVGAMGVLALAAPPKRRAPSEEPAPEWSDWATAVAFIVMTAGAAGVIYLLLGLI